MPVAKTKINSNLEVAATPLAPVEEKKEEKKNCCSFKCGSTCCQQNPGRKILLTLVGILLAYVIIWVGTMIRNNLQEYYFIGKMDRSERMITLDAQGKVTVKPDLGVTTMGMIAEAKTVAEAQTKNTEVMNKLITELKALGVEEKDIQTANYNVYPQYDYTDGKSVLNGYQVNQNITIKIRDLSKADQILGLAGQVGANSVSGLQFTFDDDEVYRAQAREDALKKISEKVQILSGQLGVSFTNVVSYNEYSGDGGYYPVRYASEAVGLGGGGSAPSIQSGANDVVMNVNVTFAIR